MATCSRTPCEQKDARTAASEESELFPLVRELLDAEQLQALGQQMQATITELQEEGLSAREQLTQDLGELQE